MKMILELVEIIFDETNGLTYTKHCLWYIIYNTILFRNFPSLHYKWISMFWHEPHYLLLKNVNKCIFLSFRIWWFISFFIVWVSSDY